MSRLAAAMLVWSAVLLGSASLSAQPAAAAPGDTAEDAGARAVALGQRAMRDFEQRHWGEALLAFRHADATFHSPVFTLYEARSLRQLRRLREARAAFERVLAEPLAEDSSEPWRRAHDDARSELTALLEELPTLTLHLDGSASHVNVTLDGQPVPVEQVLEVDPGAHRLLLVHGERRQEQSVVLALGERKRVRMAIPVAPPARLAPSSSAPSRPHVTLLQRPTLPGWILVGGGGAALVASGVVGALALDRAADARDHLPSGCHDQVCLNRERTNVDASFAGARGLAVAADVLWISGALATAAGAGWVIIASRTGRATEVSVRPAAVVVSARF